MTRVGFLLAISQIFFLPVYGYQYLGCYIEKADRDLPYLFERFSTSPSKCNQLCTGRKFQFFGLQAANECWCGNGYGRYGPTWNVECNRKCSSDDKAICGSVWRNSLYASDLIDNREEPKMRFLGCYADHENRDLSVLASSEMSMSVNKCHALCKERRFAYFGVQAGHFCFCGNSYGRYEERNVFDCRSDCRGDRSQYCGGEWRNSVYSVAYESTEVMEPMNPEVKEKLLKSISKEFPYGLVCDTCLIAAWNKRLADVKFRRFAMKDLPSVSSSYPEKISVVLKNIEYSAEITFEDLEFKLDGNFAIRKFTVGMARRVNENVEFWLLSGDFVAYLVPKFNALISGGLEKRDYLPGEVTLIEKGLRDEAYKLFDNKLKITK